MRQGAPILVFRLDTQHQPYFATTGLDQCLQALTRGFGEGLAGFAFATDLGGIDANKTNTAPIFQTQGVAVDHLTNAHALGIDRGRAEGLCR
ncbi:hypothetical protein D3C79_772290 [compost metagenome]